MLTSLILILISILIIIVACLLLSNIKRIAAEGVDVEGIIFDKEQSIDNSGFYPVVRFVTEYDEWITEPSKISVLAWNYKVGSKVSVVYQKNNPKNFFIKDSSTYVVPWIMIGMSICMLIGGLISLLTTLAQ